MNWSGQPGSNPRHPAWAAAPRTTELIPAPAFVKPDRGLGRELAVTPRSARLVRHLLEFARGEQLAVIAEGIETEAEQAAVQALGVPYLQGYRFGRPARTFLPPLI